MKKYWYDAVIKEVYDGDTVTIDIDLGFHVWALNQKFRLYGINAPEIRGETKERGIEVRNILREWILDKPVLIYTVKDSKDKYGRWLCEIYLESGGQYQNINERLIQLGYADVYQETIK